MDLRLVACLEAEVLVASLAFQVAVYQVAVAFSRGLEVMVAKEDTAATVCTVASVSVCVDCCAVYAQEAFCDNT